MMRITDDDWSRHNERVEAFAHIFTHIVNGSVAAANAELTAYGLVVAAILAAMPPAAPPPTHRSRVAWAKRKHKRFP